MTDDVLDDPILDDQIRRALTALADSHSPTLNGPAGREPKRHRLLAVAAAVLVVAGVGALLLAGQREGADRPVSTQAPAPIDSAAPDPAEPEPTDPSSSIVPATEALRFETPLPEDTIAVLDPAPFPFLEAFRVGQTDIEFLSGRGANVQILVLDADGSVAATVSVTDLDVPLDTIESDERLAVGDGTTLNYAGVGAETLFAVAGSSIRELSVQNLRSTDNEFSQFDERLALATEVAGYVEGQQLDDLGQTRRFAPSPAPDGTPTVVSYDETSSQGEGGHVQVAIIATESAVDSGDFTLLASAFGEILDRPAPNATVVEMIESPQLQYIEQISPNQFVVIVTDLDTDRETLDTFISSLSFVDAPTAGIDVDPLGGEFAPVVARGDDRWGRWELYEPTGGGDCHGFGATVWSPGSRDTQQSSSIQCRSDDGAPSEFVCLTMSAGQLAGLYLGDGVIGFEDPSIDVAIVGEPGDPIDGLGLPQSFLIDPVSGVDPVSVLIDGEPVALPCN